jgi:hypothetical protein
MTWSTAEEDPGNRSEDYSSNRLVNSERFSIPSIFIVADLEVNFIGFF